MKKSLLRGLVCSPLLLALCAVAGLAQDQTHYVYTNNNVAQSQGPPSKAKDPALVPIFTSNTISGFAVQGDGSLVELASSPFNTGGNGNGVPGNGLGIAFPAATMISTLIVGDYLYAVNNGSGDVSGFQIDPATGNLTPVAGSPFAVTQGNSLLALTPTPDGKYLIVADAVPGILHVYAIDTNGSLGEVAGSPFSTSGGNLVHDLHVTPDGKYLTASFVYAEAIDVLAIGDDGSLTPVDGSPFPLGAFVHPSGLDVTCSSDRLYAGSSSDDDPASILGFGIAPDGSLTPLPNSPYPARNPNSADNVRLSVDDDYLFVSNLGLNNGTSVSTFAVAPDGSLSEISGSPFVDDGVNGYGPFGLAVDASGDFLFATNSGNVNSVSSFVVAPDGSLTAAPGSPYPTNEGGWPSSITAYPSKACIISAAGIECPGNVTVASTFVVDCTPSAEVTFDTPIGTTSCQGGNVTVTCEPASGSVFPEGVTTVVCTATDDCGGSPAICSFTVTVTDAAPPVIECPENVTTGNDAGSCSAVVAFDTPLATDDCASGNATVVEDVVCSPASGSTFPQGTTTVTCTATDDVGNTAQCTFTVTVDDTEAPTVQCPGNVTQNTDANLCTAVVNYAAPTASDNCSSSGNITVLCSPASGSIFPKGMTSVSCTATDQAGNTSQACGFTVTVEDHQNPTIACPSNVTASTGSACNAVVNYTTPSGSDNCAVQGVVCTPSSGSTFNAGVTTVTCTATDTSGNTAQCMFTVTVNDNTPPTITCPSNATATANAVSGCTFGAAVSFAAPVGADNCGNVTVACVPASGSFFPQGTTTVTCTATAGGGTAQCSFTVTVGLPAGTVCLDDEQNHDTFVEVVDQASPLYGYWQYHVAATGETLCGRANKVTYQASRSLVSSDNDYSAENRNVYMDVNVNFGTHSGTVTVSFKGTSRKNTLRDRDTRNDPPCGASGGNGGGQGHP